MRRDLGNEEGFIYGGWMGGSARVCGVLIGCCEGA